MVDKADRNRRQELPLARTVSIPRDRHRLAIWEELSEFVNENCYPGAWFRSHGDAGEKGLGRLQNEQEFITRRCRESKTPFRWEAFVRLYQADFDRMPERLLGRPRKDAQNAEPQTVLGDFTMADALVSYANNTWVKREACDRLAQVVELGLCRLQRGGYRVDEDSEEPKVSVPPDAFWAAYRKEPLQITEPRREA